MERYLGLISGTSADGIEAVAADFDAAGRIRVHARRHHPYPPGLRERVLRLSLALPALTPAEYAALDHDLGAAFAAAAQALIESAGLDPATLRAIGSHGQTVFHDASRGLTTQLGDPNLIAARTGIDTIADFRRADLALGGQGAPLVPAFHHALFADAGRPTAVLNLGGIGNVTLLPDAVSAQVRGFDTGPANGLMDEWMVLRLGQAFDRDGACAARGRIIEPMLAALRADPYFALPPPKSTGRDYFRLDWVRRCWPALDAEPVEDVQATLCELTAASVADAVQAQLPAARDLLVCGGGARNGFLMQRLAARLPGVAVTTTDTRGLDAEAVEASAFAWLAMRHVRRLPGNLPGVTGASRAVVLGACYPAPR